MIKPIKRTRQIVLDAVLDLHAAGTVVTPEALADYCGLSRTVVGEHVKLLREEELIHTPGRGVYVPARLAPPPRAISMTAMPGGGQVKLEVGDHVLDLWPQELQALRFLVAGPSAPFPQSAFGPEVVVVRRKRPPAAAVAVAPQDEA